MALDKKTPMYGYNFTRTRHDTQLDALDLSSELRNRVAKYVMNESYVPKKWRYFDGKPAVDSAAYIRNCISRANDIKIGTDDSDPDMVRERLRLQRVALSYCNVLQLQLIDITNDCEGATDENMRAIIDTLNKLIQKLIKWHKVDCDRSGL